MTVVEIGAALTWGGSKGAARQLNGLLWLWEERRERGLGAGGCGVVKVPGTVVQAGEAEELVGCKLREETVEEEKEAWGLLQE